MSEEQEQQQPYRHISSPDSQSHPGTQRHSPPPPRQEQQLGRGLHGLIQATRQDELSSPRQDQQLVRGIHGLLDQRNAGNRQEEISSPRHEQQVRHSIDEVYQRQEMKQEAMTGDEARRCN